MKIEYNTPTSGRHPIMDENVLWTCMKKCSVCKEIKSLNLFPRRVAVDNGKEAMCKACVASYKHQLYKKNHANEREKRKINYLKNREHYKAQSRARYHRIAQEDNVKRRCRKRGITIERYNHILISQKYKCAICFIWLPENERSIDHCHTTNIVRGILCDNCNTGLGLFKDSIDRFESAIRYLRNARTEG